MMFPSPIFSRFFQKTTIFVAFALQTLVLNAQNLQRIGHLSYTPPVTLAGCWHHVDAAGGEWALVGTSKGLSIVDLQNPAQPVERFLVPGSQNNWREVRTWAGYAYVGSEAPGSAITIVNLNHLPDTVYWKVWTGDGPFEGMIIKSHALQTHDGFLYIFGGGNVTNGATIADLSDPWNPHIAGAYTVNYVHDGYIRGDTLWTSEIYAGWFGVVDISDKSAPVLLTTQPTPGVFNHNSGLSDNGRVLFTTDEKSGAPLAAFDVSNLDDIRLLDTYFPSVKPAGEVHNVRVMPGDYLVCPSYRGQLTIVDGSQPDNLIEVAWDSLGNSLVWDADPYLPSGNIIATAKNEGLFIYKPQYQRAARIEGLVTDAFTNIPLAGAKVFVLNTPNADTTGADGIFKTGASATGGYSLRAECPGYQPRVASNITLTSGTTAYYHFKLQALSVATDDPANEPAIRVSPTPFRDALQVEIFNKGFIEKPARLRLRDVAGNIRREEAVPPSGKTKWTGLGDLPTGVYVLCAEFETGQLKTMRVIKI
ncbi:MAG: choice-of-anchor B family protein [Saprospiraceae bacterium]|nr:choice-of-anchor B family protein [Saprospiraceae bacterium]